MQDETVKVQIKELFNRVGHVEKQQENMNTKLTEINGNVIEILAIQKSRVEIEQLKNDKIYTELKQDNKSNTDRIDKIESNSLWLWRTIAGTIIITLIGLFFKL